MPMEQGICSKIKLDIGEKFHHWSDFFPFNIQIT